MRLVRVGFTRSAALVRMETISALGVGDLTQQRSCRRAVRSASDAGKGVRNRREDGGGGQRGVQRGLRFVSATTVVRLSRGMMLVGLVVGIYQVGIRDDIHMICLDICTTIIGS